MEPVSLAISVTITIVLIVISFFTATGRRIAHHLKLEANIPANHRNVFITGCDTGFGHLAAIEFAKKGFTVFAGCFTKDGESKLADADSNIKPVPLDVTKQESVDAAKAFVEKELGSNGGLWAILNNAGSIGANAVDSLLNVEDYKSCFELNFFACIRVVHAFQGLVKKTRGRIVNTCSIASHISFGGSAPYISSKFAIYGYTDTLRKEHLFDGVKVIAICPGFHATNLFNIPLMEKNLQDRVDRLSTEDRRALPQDYVKRKIQGSVEAINEFAAGNKPENVVNAYVQAATERFPRQTYWVGNDANWSVRLTRMCNDDVTDAVGKLMANKFKDPDAE